MTTRVIVTGTGTPIVNPDRAGPGVLVSHDDRHLLFDAGRATVMRLAATGLSLRELTALFLTHQHSDHVVGLPDLLMTRWLEGTGTTGDPLPVYAPSGMAADLAQHVLVPWNRELAMRGEHQGYPGSPFPEMHDFEPPATPQRVFTAGDIVIEAVQVRHEPVPGAVGYRVTTPDGAVAVSGDTAICDEVEKLAKGAAVLVHEVFAQDMLPDGLISNADSIGAYHSPPDGVGALARRAGVSTLMLTHLIPAPSTVDDYTRFSDAVRAGGFNGEIIVCDDLATVSFG